MKLRQLFCLAGIFLPAFVLADDVSPFTAASASAQQEYHAVDADHPATVAVPAVAPAPPPVAVSASANTDTPDKSVSIVTNTQKEITDLTQNTLSFEQQADQRIQDLTDSNHAMGGAIQTLMQQVAQLQQQLGKAPSSAAMGSTFLRSLHDPETEGFLLGAFAIALLSLGVLLGRYLNRRRPRVVVVESSVPRPAPTPEQAETEYDFMSTTQAIPAKLDLARSYIAMNDLEQAKTILKTVLERGDDLQRREAGQLLQKLLR